MPSVLVAFLRRFRVGRGSDLSREVYNHLGNSARALVPPSASHTLTRPDVSCETYHAILAVADVAAAVDFYTTRLGFWLAFTEGDPPAFAGVNIGSVQLFLEAGTPTPQGCGVYFVVDDADALYRFHESSGVDILEKPGDRPYGLRDQPCRGQLDTGPPLDLNPPPGNRQG